MASSLNASTAGGGGVIVTSDATGNLNIQSGGSTVVAVTATGATVTGTLAATGAVSGTTGTFTSTLGVTGAITGSSTVAGSTGILYPLTSGTAVATTSGTSIDFTGIPSWVKRITVMLNGVSTNGTSVFIVRIGSGSIDSTSTYVGCTMTCAGTATATAAFTTSFIIANPIAASNYSGMSILTNVSGNIWTLSSNMGRNDGRFDASGGSKSLSGTLDQIRLTTVNGTDTFDAGSVNILYE